MACGSSAVGFPDRSSPFFTYLFDRSMLPATILICCKREDLLAGAQDQRGHVKVPSILAHTIRSLTLASSTTVAYADSLVHARAYLCALGGTSGPSLTPAKSGDGRVPTLAIWGLIETHRSEDEYTAQSVLRSLALATETAQRAHQGLIIAEQAYPPDLDGVEDEGGRSSATRTSCWEQRIPLLSQSIRFQGHGPQWSVHGVTVGEVVRSRCKVSIDGDRTEIMST